MKVTSIHNARHAFNVLRAARVWDARAAGAYIKGVKAVANNGTFSGHFEQSARWSVNADERFQMVEDYLERLAK